MRRSQGRYFSQDEINRIKNLLTSTDMTLQEIATRMGCAKSSVVSINQSFQIRDYRGRRSFWVVADSTREPILQVEAGAISGSPS
jgi:transcriptional regulator with XRE-family HTH domain